MFPILFRLSSKSLTIGYKDLHKFAAGYLCDLLSHKSLLGSFCSKHTIS